MKMKIHACVKILSIRITQHSFELAVLKVCISIVKEILSMCLSLVINNLLRYTDLVYLIVISNVYITSSVHKICDNSNLLI